MTDDPKNFEVYDVNTIANYDREIIPLLHAVAGSRFERGGMPQAVRLAAMKKAMSPARRPTCARPRPAGSSG